MNSQVYEDDFQLFPATKKENLDRETDVGKFAWKYIFIFENWYIQNPRA